VKPLRAGLSGCGARGLAAVEQVRRHRHCDIVAVHDEDASAWQQLLSRTGIGFGTSNFEELLGTGIDFVALAGSVTARLPHVQSAAAQAVHCLVHTPMASDLDTARAMTTVCEAAQVKLGVAVPGQDDPILDQLRRMIASDWLGGLVCVQGMLGDDLLRAPQAAREIAADPFVQLLSQHIHLVSWLCGRSAESVTAQTTSGFLPRPHDGAVATAVLRGNVLCTFSASHLTRVRALAIHGTDGGVRIAGDRIWVRGQAEYHGPAFDYVEAGREQSFTRGDLDKTLAALVPDAELHGRFARWIDDFDDFPCPAEQAICDFQVAAAMARAAVSGRTETV
jgi:predicted dehydrogenase